MNSLSLVIVRASLLFGGMVALVGCSMETPPKPVPVSGVVVMNGKPLTRGMISFVPAAAGEGASRPSTAMIQPDGTYKATSFKEGDGLLAGSYKIVVTSDAQSLTAEEMAAGKKAVSTIPKAYTSLTTTPPSLEIPADATPIEHDVDLNDK